MKLTLTPTKKVSNINSFTDDDVQIHEGSSYQANIPPLTATPSPTDHDAILIWRPTNLVNEKDLIDYIDYAHTKHRMNEEQALAILHICKYKIVTSKSLMEQYTPTNDQWTNEDKCLFEQAFQYYGKVFSNIKQMLPDKTIAELVNYYYLWKNARLYRSLMDKHEKQCQLMSYDIDDANNDCDDGDEISSTNENSNDEQECSNCEKSTKTVHSTPKGFLCDECYVYWEKSGVMRSELYRNRSPRKNLKRPPKDMCLDLTASILDDSIEKVEDEIRREMSVIQSHNQAIESLTKQSRYEIEAMNIPFLKPNLNSNESLTSAWSTEEILLAIQAFAKYGKDFQTISRIIGPTKTVQDIEKFYSDSRERYQLDMVINMKSKPITHLQDDIIILSDD